AVILPTARIKQPLNRARVATTNVPTGNHADFGGNINSAGVGSAGRSCTGEIRSGMRRSAMSTALAFVACVMWATRPPGQFMGVLIGSERAIALADAWRGPCECTSILRRRALGIREPVLAQDLFGQLFIDVRGYQLAKCNRGRVVLSLA